MLNSLLPNLIIACIGIMPLLASSFLLIEDGLISSPDQLKSVWGIVFSMIGLSWWLLSQIRSGKIKVVKSSLYAPIFGFLFWCFLSLLWIEDGYLAAITLAQFSSFAVIFLLIVNVFKGFDLAIRTLKVLVVSMTVVSVVGLLQYYFPENNTIASMFMQAVSPGATFGNKNMASHFLVMVLPLSFVLLLTAKTNLKVALYSLALFVGSWFLMYTTARQAYVAIAVELIVLGVFFLLDQHQNRKQSLLNNLTNKFVKYIHIVGVAIFLVLVSNLGPDGWDFDSENKLNKVQSINLAGANARLPAWRNTLEMIKDNPVTGVGIGQWAQSYPLYYDRVMKDVIFNEKVRLKRLHNEYLETLADVGLVGYVFLLWLLFLITRKTLRTLSDVDNQYRTQVLGVTLGLVGFSVVAFFSFPIKVYLPAFLVFVYFSIILLSRDGFLSEGNIVNYRASKYSQMGLFFVVLLTIFSVYYSYRWIMAYHYYTQSIVFYKANQDTLSLLAGLKALEYNKQSKLYYRHVGNVLSRKKQYKKAEPYFKKVVDISPFHTPALLNLALIYDDMGVKDLKKQRKVLEFVLSFDSKNIPALCFLIKNLALSNRAQDAAIVYGRLKNHFEYFKGRSNFGPYHDIVGPIAKSVGDYEYLKYIYQDAIDRFPIAKNYHKMATLEYDILKNRKSGIEFAKKALKIDPEIEELKALIEKYESSTQQY